jgi:glycosyltransferase involved in cell wall biosynthesis
MTGTILSTNPKQPVVSVLICAYNAERFIGATLRSVMAQTYGSLEVLVLDNDSSDRTKEVLEELRREEPRLKLYAGKKNLGAYGGLNYLLDRATGTYIAIQDHDDIWHPDKIARQVEFLERNAGYVGCGTAIVNYYERYGTFLLRRQPEVSRVAWHTSLIFRNSGLRYNAKARVANDFLFMKHILCRDGKRIHNLKEPYVLRMIRADRSNLSAKWISLKNLKEILFVRIGLFDKLALLNRLLLPGRIVDYLVLKVLLRKNILPRADVERRFSDDDVLQIRIALQQDRTNRLP